MIGGIDIHLPTRAGDSSLGGRRANGPGVWLSAVFENGLTGGRYDSFAEIPFRETEELFAYRDATVADAWDAEGAIPSLSNTMVHLITDPGFITIVVDEKDELMQRMIEAIASALVDELSWK